MSADFVLRLCREIENVRYVKEESTPSTFKMTAILNGSKGVCQGVFGGSGGRYLIEEHRRGCAGLIPGSHVTDVVVTLWNALEKGDETRAMQIYKDMAPLFFFEAQLNGCYKEVLYRRRGHCLPAQAQRCHANGRCRFPLPERDYESPRISHDLEEVALKRHTLERRGRCSANNRGGYEEDLMRTHSRLAGLYMLATIAVDDYALATWMDEFRAQVLEIFARICNEAGVQQAHRRRARPRRW